MKGFAIAVLLCSAGPAFAQTSSPFPAPPNLGQLFPAPSLQAPDKPEFKLEIPQWAKRFPMVPAPSFKVAPKPALNFDVDRGMVRKPQGYAQRPARPAPRRDIYPNLKIQPTEIALLGGGSCPDARLRMERIPRTFPKARVEPIPITADCLRMLPVGSSASSTP